MSNATTSTGPGRKLVIVESPTKARTITRILGKDYRVIASMGHVRDLPKRTLGVDIQNSFQPVYEETKSKNLTELRDAAKGSDMIYLATDPDREGEAIAWHLKEILAKKNPKAGFTRVEFHEITRPAVTRAFEAPRDIDYHLVDAQQARRVLDRLVGYQISPLLWSRVERGISAGRVQSVALRLVCEREREILNFVPKEYWFFDARFSRQVNPRDVYEARLAKIDGAKADIGDATTAEAVTAAINNGQRGEVTLVKTEPVFRKAPPPFITSSLQQAAGAYLRFTAARAMQIAQQLYEGADIGESGPTGLITYMRTDSFTIAEEARNACRKFIVDSYGPRYAPEKPNFFKNKSSAQEAHEAIRPTDVTRRPDDVAAFLTPEQARLYRLIWDRFVASQMAPAESRRTTIDTAVRGSDGKNYSFRTTGSVTVFDGYQKIGGSKLQEKEGDDEDGESKLPPFLPTMKVGEACQAQGLKKEQKFTEPPPRYSEATLIRELENNGIGRPSTYATIVSTIQKRDYVKRDKGKLTPEPLGFQVNDYLIATLPTLFEVGFTAEMEEKLDRIESGGESWTRMLEDFYAKLSTWIDAAKYDAAPTSDKVVRLLDLFESVQNWDAPVTRGRRTYDDRRFVTSVRKQFEKQQKLSGRQWESLLRLAARYADRLPGLPAAAAELGFAAELEQIGRPAAEESTSSAEGAPSAEDAAVAAEARQALDLMRDLVIPPPEKGAGKRFDEGDFLESLRRRAAEGKPFSEKQSRALARLAVNHREKIPRFEEVSRLLRIGVAPSSANGEGQAAGDAVAGTVSAADAEAIEKAFAVLATIETWKDPVKKGRRSFDDKAFYESLKKQYETKKTLSFKQIAALKKMTSKYARDAEKEEKT